MLKSSSNPIVGTKRKRCQQCCGCQAQDCGECKQCLDKPKYGGKGTKKQCCVKRRCIQMITPIRIIPTESSSLKTGKDDSDIIRHAHAPFLDNFLSSHWPVVNRLWNTANLSKYTITSNKEMQAETEFTL